MTAQTVTARLSVNVLSLDEGDDSTAITVTATLSENATAATTITLALPTTRPTSPFLLPGMTIATQGASDDYTTTDFSTNNTITISKDSDSATTTFNIAPSTDTATEDDETIIITGTGTGLSVLPTEVYLEDGPYVSFPAMINTQVFYLGESVGSITVPEVTDKYDTTNSQITYTHTVTPTTDYGLSFDNTTRTLSGTLNSTATAGTTIRYTITAKDDMGTTADTTDDKTATTIVSVNVIQDRCNSGTPLPTGWYPEGVTTPSDELTKDCNILLAAKASFVANSSTYTPNWDTTTSMDDWTYVELDSNRVDRLFVDHEHYAKGPIPPALGGLTALEDLAFYGTKDLNGTIPPELGSLSALKWLTLSRNKLSGAVPPELGGLANLTSLDLGSNQLSGAIPDELGQLANLMSLILPDNQLSGSIPWELGKLSELVYFILYKNKFTGIIPPWLDKLTKLESLTIYENGFTSGPIPYLPTSLTYLALRKTNRTGSLPQRLTTLTNLEILLLQDNDLSGAILEDLGKLENLESLSLRDNNLSGTIPTTWGSATHPLSNLRRLTLQNNALSGTIPASLGNLGKDTDGTTRNLDWLRLSGNQLTGAIPANLNKLAGLRVLFLHDNLLEDPLPSEFDANENLDNLFAFRFDGNESVCLPDTLKQWYDDLSLNATYQDTVEVHCAFDTLAALTTVTPGTASLTVEWGGYNYSGPLTFAASAYEVQYRPDTTGKWQTVAASASPATLPNLNPGQSYQIRYRALDDIANTTPTRYVGTKWSSPVSKTVPALTAGNVTATGATLTIEHWTDAWWYKGNQDNATCSDEVPANTVSATLNGLTASTAYTYKAYSADTCADADEIATETFTTNDPPPPVTNGGGGGGGGGGVPEPSALQNFFESPTDGAVVSGVDLIRGWSFAEARGVRIAQVDLYLDGRRHAVIPCCSARPDVTERYPRFPRANTGQSGWGITQNWGELSAGAHTLQVVVTGTDEGRWASERRRITILKPAEVAFADRFSLAEAEARLSGSHLLLDGVVLRDKTTQEEKEVVVRYAWQTGAQGLRLVASRTLETAGASPFGLKRLLAGLGRWGLGWLRPSPVTANEGLTAFYEAPAQSAEVAGIDIIRGWAFPDDPRDTIATVAVQIDETGSESAPCCSTRADVAGAFPDQTNAELSGWGVVTNYGNLAEGEHTLTARITTGAGVEYTEARTVTVSRLGGYAFVDRFDLSRAEVEIVGEEIILSGVEVRDSATQATQTIEVRLRWSPATQGLVIVDTETLP